MAEKISKEDLHLDWTRPAVELTRVVRLGQGLDDVPRQAADACSTPRLGPDRRRSPTTAGRPGSLDGPVVATGGGSLVLRQVQPESRSPMSAEEWLRGVRPAVGERLGTD